MSLKRIVTLILVMLYATIVVVAQELWSNAATSASSVLVLSFFSATH